MAARLKSLLDSSSHYQPILQGECNQQTRWLFKRAGIEPPPVRSDVRLTVGEVMQRDFPAVKESARLGEVTALLPQARGGFISAVDDADHLVGYLSARNEHSHYFFHFNVEDYLGQLVSLDDVAAALELAPLNSAPPALDLSPGSFRLATLPISSARELWQENDVILSGPSPEVIDLAAGAEGSSRDSSRLRPCRGTLSGHNKERPCRSSTSAALSWLLCPGCPRRSPPRS